MSNFDIRDNTKVSTSDKVNFNFDNILVTNLKNPGNSNSVLSTSITIPETLSTKSDLFFVHNSAVSNYKASNLYFYPLLHDNITGITDGDNGENITGELVIELNAVGGGETAYACFFMEYNKNHIYSDIDKFKALIERPNSGGNTLSLNHSIGSQDYCVYYNANPVSSSGAKDASKVIKVFVFSTPISINNDTQALFADQGKEVKSAKAAPFTTSAPTNYVVIASNISNINDDQIYIDCNLTGESAETITAYNVPINSAMSSDNGEMNYMKMTINFFIFILALLFTYTAIPVLYKMSVIDKINKWYDSETEQKKRLVGTDILISLVILSITVSLFTYGAARSNYKVQTAAMAISVLYILSFCILQIKKADATFMTTLIKPGEIRTLKDYKFDISKIRETFPILGDWFGKVLDNMSVVVSVILATIVMDVILYAMGNIDWAVFIDLLTIGSFFAGCIAIIGIGIFIQGKKLLETVKVETSNE